MDLECYVYPGWEPRIRAAGSRREWMDAAPESFPYRCLPLAIANSHGWELLSPCGFEASWNGGLAAEDVTVRADEGTTPHQAPVALFGQGTFTIHVQALFRTPPGWNLFVSGPPNTFKDGAAPLAGIIETDWSPYSFTMNWRLTRQDHTVRFEENEPIAHFFPIQRGMVETFEPKFVPIDADAELKAAFEQWSRSRDAFHRQVREHPPERPADKWQKLYYRGLKPDGACPVGDHQAKLQVRDFANPEITGSAPARMAAPVARREARDVPGPGDLQAATAAAKYAWLLTTMERQRRLSSEASGIFRCEDITGEEFLDQFYAPGRPVVIAGEIDDWPARKLWTPDYLRDKLAGRVVEYQGGRNTSPQSERFKDDHKVQAPFEQFLDAIEAQEGNDAYLTAYNSATNAEALRPLRADMGRLDKYLSYDTDEEAGMLWMGPRGTFTALHHDLTNNLLVQVAGRKKVILAPAAELPNLYNDRHVFSEVRDVSDPALDLERYARLRDVEFQEVILAPGDALFLPIGWWHQVESLDFAVSVTYTNFRWPNDHYRTYPGSG